MIVRGGRRTEMQPTTRPHDDWAPPTGGVMMLCCCWLLILVGVLLRGFSVMLNALYHRSNNKNIAHRCFAMLFNV